MNVAKKCDSNMLPPVGIYTLITLGLLCQTLKKFRPLATKAKEIPEMCGLLSAKETTGKETTQL